MHPAFTFFQSKRYAVWKTFRNFAITIKPCCGNETAAGSWCSDKNHEAGKTQNGFGEKDRGQLRPGYEIFYKHYKDVSGSYFVKKYAEVQRPECGAGDARYGSNSGAFDQIGWGTLMLYQ